MKKIALKNAARGTAFDYAGQSWILLENDDVWNRAEPYARHKNEVNRQRHPEIDYYDNDYLVLLTADTVRETEFSDLTHALCDLTVARAQ